MKRTVLVTNGRLVMPDRVVDPGEVLLEDGVIQYAGKCAEHRGRPAERVIDAQGGYIMPGFIDLHSDAIEKEIEPRPGAFFSTELAFSELEKKLAGQGITTMYHSFSFAGAEWGVRQDAGAAECIRSIAGAVQEATLIRNKIHLRYEITNYKAVPIVRELIYEGRIDLLSFMDHTPGQGQYPTVESYRKYMEKTYHTAPDETDRILAIKEEGRNKAGESVGILSTAALAAGIPLASHDDDTVEKVEYYHSQGVTISEFPINVATARAARDAFLDVCVGAPNIVRGGSTGNGLRAADAIAAGAANILCSDYYPPAILHAVFKLASGALGLAEAVAMATAAPARALGLRDLGDLSEGNTGDVIVVHVRGQVPVVTSTIVGGVPVYDITYRGAFGSAAKAQPAC
ncbi:MAG TPA: alpha-D-ribose 1-methylphosphonate 5-triphosphate diphosphatase [Selenomonadales bacterium]|nr:alpha-D-ribose 1-methylphosphonate 5-triphosphate diphosphatase [Selenomonadales bacterium]